MSSSLSSDVVEDCAAQHGPISPDEMNQREYYKFDHSKFKDLKLPAECMDSGFDSVGDSGTRSLREECEDQTEAENETSSLAMGLDNLDISSSATGQTLPEIAEVTSEINQNTSEEQIDVFSLAVPQGFTQDEEGDTDLHLAIIHNREDVADIIIKQAPSPGFLDIPNDLLQTPLHLAAYLKQSKVCRKLVMSGAAVDVRERRGQTPLHFACENGDLETVKALTIPANRLEQENMPWRTHVPQDLELRNYKGFTCVHLAASGNHVYVLDYLVRLGADINAGDGKSGRTALHYAVEAQNTQLVQYLLGTWHAYVDPMTYNQCTPLHLAAGRGYQEGIQMLIQYGADVGLPNVEQETPYDLAGQQSNMLSLLEPCVYDDFMINGQPVSL